MGFEGKKVIKLRFEDSDLDGLEVVTRKPTIEQVMAMSQRHDALPEDADEMAGLRVIADLLCEVLIGWNLENDGEPVPHTAEGLLAQDFDVAQAIIRAWEDNAIKVPVPLGEGSSSGEPSLEESIPMVVSLPSQAS